MSLDKIPPHNNERWFLAWKEKYRQTLLKARYQRTSEVLKIHNEYEEARRTEFYQTIKAKYPDLRIHLRRLKHAEKKETQDVPVGTIAQSLILMKLYTEYLLNGKYEQEIPPTYDNKIYKKRLGTGRQNWKRWSLNKKIEKLGDVLPYLDFKIEELIPVHKKMENYNPDSDDIKEEFKKYLENLIQFIGKKPLLKIIKNKEYLKKYENDIEKKDYNHGLLNLELNITPARLEVNENKDNFNLLFSKLYLNTFGAHNDITKILSGSSSIQEVDTKKINSLIKPFVDENIAEEIAQRVGITGKK